MYTLTEQDIQQVSGGINGFVVTLNIDVPISDTSAIEGLLTDLFTNQLNAATLAQALLATPNNFNDMKFVSLHITEY